MGDLSPGIPGICLVNFQTSMFAICLSGFDCESYRLQILFHFFGHIRMRSISIVQIISSSAQETRQQVFICISHEFYRSYWTVTGRGKSSQLTLQDTALSDLQNVMTQFVMIRVQRV